MKSVVEVARVFPRGGAVAKEVELSERDPAGYVRRFARRLEERDISKPVRKLAWFALVDGLIARRSAVEIDRREMSEDLLSELRDILPKPVRKALPSGKELDALSPAENRAVLKVIGDRLEAKGWSLVLIELGHDGYPLAALPVESVPALLTAVRAAGGRVKVLKGANLVALRRAHEREELAERKTEERALRQRLAAGPNWQKLLETCGPSYDLVVFGMDSATAAEQRLFIAAAPEAPKRHREHALALAALMTDPVAAARRLEPLLALRLMRHLPQDARFAGLRVRALAVLAKRIRLGSEPKSTLLFWKAAWIYTQYGAAARRAAPPEAKRWKELAEERYLAKDDIHSWLPLHWLGDQATLERLAHKSGDSAKALRKDLRKALGKQ